MFDNLRDLSDDNMDFVEPMERTFESGSQEASGSRFLGMKAGQRFFLSLMLLATVIVMGLACLLVTAKIWPF